MNLSLIVEDYCYFSLSEAKCLAEPQILTKCADSSFLNNDLILPITLEKATIYEKVNKDGHTFRLQGHYPHPLQKISITTPGVNP